MTVNDATLNAAATKYRSELLIMAVVGLGRSLEHLRLRTGVRYKEIVGELTGAAELMPYTGDMDDATDGMTIAGRTLETYLGQCIKLFDPNQLVSSLYGSAITKGDALKNVPITKAVLTLMMHKISQGLNSHLWDAVRNDAGSTTSALFNGFDTITASDIVGSKISVAAKNLYNFSEAISSTNAYDLLKAAYRSASDELRDLPVKMYMSQAAYDAYVDDYQLTVGSTPYNREFQKTFLEGSSNLCELVPLVGKKNSDYIHIAPRDNMLVGVNQLGEEETIEVRRGDNPFKLQFISTMFFGTQIESVSPERLLVCKLANDSSTSSSN